jgi:outer membrane protein OmpA-like peptidoglycan-associated protein
MKEQLSMIYTWLRSQGGVLRHLLKSSFIVMILSLASCATMPTGPSVMSLPGTGKSFDEFRADDALCRQFANQQIGGASAQQAAQSSAITSAVVGTAVGAAAGAAFGSVSGNMGAGAAIGAGTGLLFGSAAGSSAAAGSYYEAQRRYDNAYLQCMYAKGNQIPGYRRTSSARRSYPAPANYPPPPPPPKPAAKVIDKMTLRVNFDVNQSALLPSDKTVLDKAVAFVKKYPDAKIELDGYTDNTGTEAYNRWLSEKRAQTVKQYLIEQAGVDSSRISAVGRGESNPVGDNKTAEGRFENRRVEILILGE